MLTLRQDAQAIIDRALADAMPDSAVRRALECFRKPSGRLVLIAAGKAAQSEADAKVAAVIAAGKATQAAADKREAAYADAVKAFQAQVAAREAAYVKAVLGK